MISRKPRTARRISVGIYGHTAAGKTRFLFQFLNGWYASKRAETNTSCRLFLETVERQISEHDAPLATSSPFEKIAITIPNAYRQQRFLKKLSDDDRLKLIFRDLRGEALSREIDRLNQSDRKTQIAKQVHQCDAFLYFFDPLSSERPDQIEMHHARELDRARTFLRYVLRVRANHYFPVLFVQTHLDQLEKASREVQEKAEQWFRKVEAMLREEYRLLRDHYPASLLKPEDVFVQVCSVRTHQEVLQPIEKLIHLHEVARQFIKSDRSHVGAIIALILFLVLLLSAFFMLGDTFFPPRTSPSSIDPVVTKDDFQKLRRALKEYTPGHLTENRDAFRQAYYILMDADRTHHEFSPVQMKELAAAFRKASRAMHQMVLDPDLPEKERIQAAMMLEGVGRADHLADCIPEVQSIHWTLNRNRAVETLKEVLRRRNTAGSTIGETIKELIATLDHLEHDYSKNDVFSPEGQKPKLIEELRLIRTFLLDRLEEGGYPIDFQVISANDFGSGEKDSVLSLLFQPLPPGKSISIAILPNQEDSTMKTQEESYAIELGLSRNPVLEVYEASGDEWKEIQKIDLDGIQPHLPSLEQLGMPLYLHGKETYEMKILPGDYEMELRFDISRAPLNQMPLLWEAVQTDKTVQGSLSPQEKEKP